MRFNAPPGWPPAPEGWLPPPDWRPDPSWPPAPAGWSFLVPDPAAGPSAAAPQPAPAGFGTPPVAMFAPAQAPTPAPVAGAAEGTLCRFCGAGPALKGTARKHTGMIILMQFGRLPGPYCRDCGLGVTREFAAHTLVAGWWGYASMIIAPITLIIDARLLSRLHRLGPPGPPAPGGRRMDPGAPLFARWQIAGLLVPVTLLAVIVVAANS